MEEHVDIRALDPAFSLFPRRKNEISFSKITSFIGVFSVVLLGVYINWPPPYLTEELRLWLNGGKTYNYEDKINRLHYEIFFKDEIGSGSLGTLLCLHGFPTSSFDWKKIHKELKEVFSRVITPDFIGFGFSQKPIVHHIIVSDPVEIIQKAHNYSISQQADIIEALLEEINVSDYHILAHDYGDSVAQELILRDNKRNTEKQKVSLKILSLCLLNGGIIPDAHNPLIIQKLLQYPLLDWVFSSLGNYWAFRYSLKRVFGSDSQPNDRDVWNWWVQLRHRDGNLILGKLLNYIHERQISKHNWINALKETEVPLMMIYGPKDPVNPPPFDDYYRQLFPKSNISILENIGHYVQWEAPKEMMKLYSSFVFNL